MSSYVIEINEQKSSGKSLIAFLKTLDSVIRVVPQSADKQMKKAVTLTDEEMERIEKSRKSGVASLDELKKFLRQ